MVFSNVRLTAVQLRNAFFAFLGPVLGIATLAYVSTTTATDLQFVGDSNSTTSGGFGPNQVASVLGLGLVFVLLVLLEYRGAFRSRATLLIIAVLLAAQSALTFSRGGIVIASASAFMAILYLVREPRTRVTLVVLGATLFAVGTWIVVPRLDEFTGGKLVERYSSFDSSNRDVIAALDMRVFFDNPALGVGPGAASELRRDFGDFAVTSAAHTEYTRMLAEHGIPGLIAIVLLLVLALRLVRDTRSIRTRAVVVALLTWVALFMLINAMRIAAPAVVVGIACAIANTSRIDPRLLERARQS
ncbi:MAG: O-antigen ligase family protein [Kofleriaceae bacterium]